MDSEENAHSLVKANPLFEFIPEEKKTLSPLSPDSNEMGKSS